MMAMGFRTYLEGFKIKISFIIFLTTEYYFIVEKLENSRKHE